MEAKKTVVTSDNGIEWTPEGGGLLEAEVVCGESRSMIATNEYVPEDQMSVFSLETKKWAIMVALDFNLKNLTPSIDLITELAGSIIEWIQQSENEKDRRLRMWCTERLATPNFNSCAEIIMNQIKGLYGFLLDDNKG